MKYSPKVVDVQLGLDVLLAIEGDERRLVTLPNEVDRVPDFFQSSRFSAPVLADVPGEAVLSRKGRLAEVVLVDPLGLPVELVGAFGNGRDRRISELHAFRNVGVPDFVIPVGVVATLQLVRLELVENGFRRSLLLPLLASPAFSFLLVFIFEVTLVLLRILVQNLTLLIFYSHFDLKACVFSSIS